MKGVDEVGGCWPVLGIKYRYLSLMLRLLLFCTYIAVNLKELGSWWLGAAPAGELQGTTQYEVAVVAFTCKLRSCQ